MSCDIIIPVWNNPALTKDCIDSIFRNTAGIEYRLVLIDNASSSETKNYLEHIVEENKDKAYLIRNEQNLGFVKAVNQGIAASKASYVCVLNNDTIVSKGWLKEMVAVAELHRDIGLVNPSSNNLGQKPADGEPLDLYAEKISKEAGKYIELGAAIGFCMLIKRKVIDDVGVFDEIYGMGNFDDTDFSRRAVHAGFRCVRACGAYVYHRENASFNKRKSFDEDFKRNREIYEFRWGKPRRVAYLLEGLDANLLKKTNIDAVNLARNGNWVWYFSNGPVDAPSHSNIILRDLSEAFFYPKAIFAILKRKKKFDEIFVREESVGKLLGRLQFIHKAKIKYF